MYSTAAVYEVVQLHQKLKFLAQRLPQLLSLLLAVELLEQLVPCL